MPPAPQHTVSIAFVRSAVGALDDIGRRAALQCAGIAPELLASDAARVPAAAFAALWLAVGEALDDEFFGLDARRMKVGSFALLCHALVGQRSVERALKQALRGLALFLDDIGATLSTQGGAARITIANRIAAPDARRFADETLLVMVHGLLCWLAGRRVPLARLDWAHPRPSHADEYRRMFAPVLHFDQPATAISFDARVLRGELAIVPAALSAFLRDAPQSVFLKQVNPAGWAERVRRQLRRALLADSAEGPTLEALARQFGLSPATLRRRLDDEGAGWQALKDEVRRDLAIHHLADRRLSIEQVAAQLGFTDASSFHRAFRKWTGAAPGAYRAS
ncbi:AraC family transcriptional regulator [Aquincola sp. S2]|uniref:AraC family transcriptional regulator n=1 Tax=Pseudaquabacterium terrae TaxID=2732868 RepID=A0ABX2ENM0_9BURK|nr:AraC family transcriptional regulator [Aquabacterium terrae]NRF70168.1 AraC family transcriptional regulator [Aquabacterium terrae]